MTNIYKMGLHDIADLNSQVQVLRVPGGWIYIMQTSTIGEFSACFVPFNNEFQDEANTETN